MAISVIMFGIIIAKLAIRFEVLQVGWESLSLHIVLCRLVVRLQLSCKVYVNYTPHNRKMHTLW
jgi:hypothetical protein